MKKRYPIPILLITVGGIFVSKRSEDHQTQTRITTEAISPAKTVDPNPKNQNAPSEEATIVLGPQVKESTSITTKAVDGIREQKEVTKETENDFKALKIPGKLAETKEIRYKQVMEIYQKTSFYLSEIASGNIQPEKSNLKKAFTGVSVYFQEVNPADGLEDDALVMIEENYPANFEEALKEMPRKDELMIRKILKLQKDSE